MSVLLVQRGGAGAGTRINLTDKNVTAEQNFAVTKSLIQAATGRAAPGPRITATKTSKATRRPKLK